MIDILKNKTYKKDVALTYLDMKFVQVDDVVADMVCIDCDLYVGNKNITLSDIDKNRMCGHTDSSCEPYMNNGVLRQKIYKLLKNNGIKSFR